MCCTLQSIHSISTLNMDMNSTKILPPFYPAVTICQFVTQKKTQLQLQSEIGTRCMGDGHVGLLRGIRPTRGLLS